MAAGRMCALAVSLPISGYELSYYRGFEADEFGTKPIDAAGREGGWTAARGRPPDDGEDERCTQSDFAADCDRAPDAPEQSLCGKGGSAVGTHGSRAALVINDHTKVANRGEQRMSHR